jgi:hypothetical protein
VYTQQHEVKLFINGLGGTHPVTFWVFFVGGLSLCFTLQTVQTWFMGYWAEQYDIYPPERVNIALCVSIFHYFSSFHYFLLILLVLRLLVTSLYTGLSYSRW